VNLSPGATRRRRISRLVRPASPLQFDDRLPGGELKPSSATAYGRWSERRIFGKEMGLSPEPITLPYAVMLLERASDVPFRFSPVAPGYFLPSPGWIRGQAELPHREVSTNAPNPRVLRWSAGHVRNILQRLQELLGEDVYSEVLAKDRRGMNSKTSPVDRHPLARLIHGFSPAIHLALQEARPYIDPAVVAELHAIVEILQRAAKETVWEEIRSTCSTAHDFRHMLIEFLTVEMLERTFRRVLPVLSTTNEKREPDLKLDLQPPMHLEVKVPQRLVRTLADTSELDADHATDLVDRLTRSAIGSSGQIRADRPGMLAIGGFNLVGEEVQRLEASATAYMARRGQRYPFLVSMGLTFLDIGRAANIPGAARAMPVFNLVRNPHAIAAFP